MATNQNIAADKAGPEQHRHLPVVAPDGSAHYVPSMGVRAAVQRDYSHIQGWGADLDRKNRPGYPMERTPPRLEGLHWDRPDDQPVRMKVYHSIERPGMTPVFGTSTPPTGLSGKIRDIAYKMSENDIRHWLLLMFADRVNMVEGIGEDLMRGHIPNIFSEMGARAELRHNPTGFATKAAVVLGIAGAAYYLFRRRPDQRMQRRGTPRRMRPAYPEQFHR